MCFDNVILLRYATRINAVMYAYGIYASLLTGEINQCEEKYNH